MSDKKIKEVVETIVFCSECNKEADKAEVSDDNT